MALKGNNIDLIGGTEGCTSSNCKPTESAHAQRIKGSNNSNDLGYCSAGCRETLVLPLQASCESNSEKCAFADSVVASTSSSESVKSASVLSNNELLRRKEQLFRCTAMKPKDSHDLLKQDLLLQDDTKSSLSDSLQLSRGVPDAPSVGATFIADRRFIMSCVQNPATSTIPVFSSPPSGTTLSPAASTPVLSSLPTSTAHLPMTSEPVEELYDGATVCDDHELSSPGTVSTFLPTPCSSPSQGSVSLGLSPSPGILQPQAIENLQHLTTSERSPGGLHKIVYNGAAIVDEPFDSSCVSSSSVSTAAAELSEKPPSPKRKFLPFDSSYKVEASHFVARATGTHPRSDIDALFEL
eukprot:Em0011g745a